MNKTLSPAAVVALKDALTNIYWRKNDLRSFLNACMKNNSLLAGCDWINDTKRDIVSNLIDAMLNSPETYLSDLTNICYDVCNMTDFTHLRQLEDGAIKIKKATDSVTQLKKLVTPHKDKKTEEELIKKRQENTEQKRKKTQASREKLEQIKTDYFSLFVSDNPQKRGFKLEKIMRDLFELYDLDPKASFKVVGEQIDGAFSLNGTDYLFEAKWQNNMADNADLLVFAGKIHAKLQNTLGLFLSINGFSPTGIEAFLKSNRSSVVLMDGEDLMAALEERITFSDLLVRKKQHASQTGNIYLTYRQISNPK